MALNVTWLGGASFRLVDSAGNVVFLDLAGLPDDGDRLIAIGFAPNRLVSRAALVGTKAQPQTQTVNRLAA